MKLGFARRDITPDFPVPLAGYASANIRISAGIHDKLSVRVLVFSGPGGLDTGTIRPAGGRPDTDKTIALLQFDLLGLDHLCMEKIREGAAALGLEKDQVLAFSIHTHSGYGGIFDMEEGIKGDYKSLFGPFDPRLVELTVRESLAALEEALQNGEETTVRINRGSIEGLGTNRHGPELPCDKGLFMMEFFRLDRRRALLYNLACHPTVMNGENLLLSADVPGALASRLEDVPGGYDLVFFVNGAAGDMSTRFTRREAGFDECKRFAVLIEKALAALRRGVFLPLEKVRLEYHRIALRRAELPDRKEAEEQLERALHHHEALKAEGAEASLIRRAESLVEGARINLTKVRLADSRIAEAGKTPAASITVETGILTINGETILCPPLELFSSLSLELQRQKMVNIFGYANALLGYLAGVEAYDAGEYEALFSDFARGEGEHYIEELSALLENR